MKYQLILGVCDSDKIELWKCDRQIPIGSWILYWILDGIDFDGRFYNYSFREAKVLGCSAAPLPGSPDIDYSITLPARPECTAYKFGTIWTDTSKYDEPYCYGVGKRSRHLYSGTPAEIERDMIATFTEQFLTTAEQELE